MRLRKISRFLLALVLILGLCVPAAFAAPQTSFVITQPGQMPKAGESVSVTVELTGGVEFSAVQFTLRYNQAELSCDRVSLGAVLSDALSASNPSAPDGAIIAAASLSPMRASGVLATVTFTAKSDVTDFDFALADVVLAEESGGDVSYTVTGAAEEAGPSGGQQPGGQNPDGQRPGEQPDGGRPERDPADFPPEPDPGVFPQGPDQEATLFEEDSPSFPDAAGHWGAPFINRAASLGLFRGYADGTFRPDEKVTRAQFVTVLWRLAGKPASGGAAPFADTASLNQEFQDAVAWGYGRGYVNGRSDASFDPGGELTRQEAMAILFRYSGGESGMEAMFTGAYDAQFADSGQVAAWAKPAMYWGIYHGLITGTGEHALSPGADATRAQLAKIMVQYIDRYQKEAKE